MDHGGSSRVNDAFAMAESIVMRWLVVLAIAATALRAEAHVAASVDDNNRYLKLTPAGDRIRLAYTVFYGEVPGAAARQSIDADRNGEIGEAEASAFGERLATEIRDGMAVTLDGAPVAVTWARVAVGMGTPATTGGSFSIDLIAYFCFTATGAHHTFTLRDALKLPRPGESEVHIEDAPGIRIDHARLGRLVAAAQDFRFAGPGGPLVDPGLDLALTVGPGAKRGGEPACASADHRRSTGARLALGVLAGILALGGAAFVWRRRRSLSLTPGTKRRPSGRR